MGLSGEEGVVRRGSVGRGFVGGFVGEGGLYWFC